MDSKRSHTTLMDVLVGQRLADIRRIEGYSQSEIVRAMSGRGFPWHQTTVSRIERGDRALSLAEAAELADHLGVPVTAFLGSDYSPALPSPLELIDRLVRDATELRAIHGDEAA